MKKRIFFSGLVMLLFASLNFKNIGQAQGMLKGGLLFSAPVALAEDDEEDGEDEGDDDEGGGSKSASSQPTTKVIKLPDQIVTKTIIETVVLDDTDKDGIADQDDAYPQISDFLIVQDANGNGIDDDYEPNIPQEGGAN